MKKIGLFGGSFNPIHIGHLALANYLCEFSHLDEVWFIVSPQNPLKRNAQLWDDDLRLELARLATEDYPKFLKTVIFHHILLGMLCIRTRTASLGIRTTRSKET